MNVLVGNKRIGTLGNNGLDLHDESTPLLEAEGQSVDILLSTVTNLHWKLRNTSKYDHNFLNLSLGNQVIFDKNGPTKGLPSSLNN